MRETRKTIVIAAVAAVLAILAAVTAPRQSTPDAFFDKGEVFFPDFTDPNAARTLEVIDFDAETGSAVPFKVTFDGKVWKIPSHHDYPADGKDRLAETAAGMIGITKDDFRTDNPSDWAACGVIDPLEDSNPSLEGRGKRVTIKGENDVVLADLIIGTAIEGRENVRLVRVPGQKRVYASLLDMEISTDFSDWIEADLMLIDKEEVDAIVLKDYSIDERTGRLNERDQINLTREDAAWVAAGAGEDEEVDASKMFALVQAIDELSIEGVRPKPEGLSASLSKSEAAQISNADMLDLQSKGYYFTRDGRLVSNEGEVQVRSTDGVTYTLRFGEVVYGSGAAVSAGSATRGDSDPGENRYLMITAAFDPSLFDEPPLPDNTDFQSKPDSLWTEADYRMRGLQQAHDDWSRKVDQGFARMQMLNARFADWYYVISSESFDSLRLNRGDVIREKSG